MLQRFPRNLLPSTFLDAGNLQARNEVHRREQYIEILEALVGRYHPALVELVKECLNNAPDERPTTDDLLARLQRMREEVEGEYGNPVRLDMARVKLAKEVKQLTQQQVYTIVNSTTCTLIVKCLQERHEAVLRGKTKELEDKTREIEVHARDMN